MITPNGEKFVGEWQNGKFVEVASGDSYLEIKGNGASEDEAKVVGVRR
jgi:hypothetical protein